MYPEPEVLPGYPTPEDAATLTVGGGAVESVDPTSAPASVGYSDFVFTANSRDGTPTADGGFRVVGPLFIESPLGIPVVVRSADIEVDGDGNVAGTATLPSIDMEAIGGLLLVLDPLDPSLYIGTRVGSGVKDQWSNTSAQIMDDPDADGFSFRGVFDPSVDVTTVSRYAGSIAIRPEPPSTSREGSGSTGTILTSPHRSARAPTGLTHGHRASGIGYPTTSRTSGRSRLPSERRDVQESRLAGVARFAVGLWAISHRSAGRC